MVSEKIFEISANQNTLLVTFAATLNIRSAIKTQNFVKYHLMNIPAKFGAIQTTTDAKYLQ